MRGSLDMLRSRRSRREEAFADHTLEPVAAGQAAIDPEQEAVLGDSVGLALLVVLEKLTPAERVAFVLHDTFGVPFEQIAPIVRRTADATRQLATRARRRVRGATVASEADLARQRDIVDAFRAASCEGDLDRLLALLDPEAVVRSDATAVGLGLAPAMRGAPTVTALFKGAGQGRGSGRGRRSSRPGLGARRPAQRRVRVHAGGRQDRGHRPGRRSRPPRGAGGGDPRRLTWRPGVRVA